MMSTSLSIVLGMPTTAIFKERFLHSSEMALLHGVLKKEKGRDKFVAHNEER